jgi:hypothetical protein
MLVFIGSVIKPFCESLWIALAWKWRKFGDLYLGKWQNERVWESQVSYINTEMPSLTIAHRDCICADLNYFSDISDLLQLSLWGNNYWKKSGASQKWWWWVFIIYLWVIKQLDSILEIFHLNTFCIRPTLLEFGCNHKFNFYCLVSVLFVHDIKSKYYIPRVKLNKKQT